MTRFATFATLYLMALYLEPAERWLYPIFTGILLALAAMVLVVGLTRWTLPVLLVPATVHPLLTLFPDVANHVNIEIACNVMLLVAIGYSIAHRDRFPTDDDCFELVRPVLQVTMIAVYVMAGFAKLNRDFLNPAVSCVADMMHDLRTVAGIRVPLLHLPAGPFLLAGVGVVAAALVTTRGTGRAVRPVTRAGTFGLIVAPGVLTLGFAPDAPARTAAIAILAMSCVVILWELVGGMLLSVPRFQGPLLAFCWMMHATLSLIGFVHFGALAFAMLFTFVPAPYMDLMTSDVRLPLVKRTVPRAFVFFGIGAMAGVVSGLGERLPSAILFNVAALVMLWPVLRSLAAQAPRPTWPGTPIGNRLTPVWLYALPVLLVLHGLTGYAGLRTSGNFTMFSNLRTEGERSNHLLLAGNPLKIWGYQEDVVHFTSFDKRLSPPGYEGQSLEGQELPVVEFRKWIYRWTQAGMVVPLSFRYQGQVYTTPNIVTDPVWRTPERTWAMRLLDFRVIQTEGPNRCRW
ncbi:MAG TPA: hypothetical protein VJQ46_12365 [Gemmatimonadales bacterium]|nr:hypothetical protein [Gemmatimonadales bacterium]